MEKQWNSRFVVFAKTNGRTPEQQDEIDRNGTHKMEFILWMDEQWRQFAKSIGTTVEWARAKQEEFDNYLEKTYK